MQYSPRCGYVRARSRYVQCAGPAGRRKLGSGSVSGSTFGSSGRPRQRRQLPFAASRGRRVPRARHVPDDRDPSKRRGCEPPRRGADFKSQIHPPRTGCPRARGRRAGRALRPLGGLRAARARAEAILVALALDERSTFGLAALRASLEAYRGVLDRQLSAFAAAYLPRAPVLEAGVVGPTREAFRRVREATMARLETCATDTATAADVGTLTSLLSSAILVSLLFRRWERARRRSAFLVGEQHGLRESEARFRAWSSTRPTSYRWSSLGMEPAGLRQPVGRAPPRGAGRRAPWPGAPPQRTSSTPTTAGSSKSCSRPRLTSSPIARWSGASGPATRSVAPAASWPTSNRHDQRLQSTRPTRPPGSSSTAAT